MPLSGGRQPAFATIHLGVLGKEHLVIILVGHSISGLSVKSKIVSQCEMIVEFIVPFPITRHNCDSGNGEKMTCISAPTELQYRKLKTPKEPFPPGAALLLHLVEKGSLTTYLTTPSAGAPGNSGFETAKEYRESSGKQRKSLQTPTKNLVQPFGTIRPGVRVSHLGPLETKPAFNDSSTQVLPVFGKIDQNCSLELAIIAYCRY